LVVYYFNSKSGIRYIAGTILKLKFFIGGGSYKY